MNKNQFEFSDINNRLENIQFKLVFLEAALRGMTGLGIIEEKGISEGVSCIFNSIIHEHEIIANQFQKILMSSGSTAGDKNS